MLKPLIIKPLWGGGGRDYVEPHVVLVEETNTVSYKAITPPPLPAMAGDIAYWDGSSVKTCTVDTWSTSLGTPVGVIVIPEGFAPDGKVRIISLKGVDSNGNQTEYHELVWAEYGLRTPLLQYTVLPTTDNVGSTSTGSNTSGYLPSDNFEGAQSYVDPEAKYVGYAPYIPSPYLGDAPNPEYYKTLDGGNVFSDFNGLSNTQSIVELSSTHTAANACWKYSDGASNLQWYLPAAGEMGYILPRLNIINETLAIVGGTVFPLSSGKLFLWSTEYNSKFAHFLEMGDGYVFTTSKDYEGYVRPFATI